MHRSLLIVAILAFSMSLITSVNTVRAEDNNLDALLEQLATAPSELEGRVAEEAVWNFWFDQSPTDDVRSALDAALERRKAYDYEAAENHLNEVVKLAPDYSEGYNQRAFVRFLRENYSAAQADLEKTLELEPKHFGALSGLFHVLSRQDRRDAALSALQQAVTLHPWIKERFALPEQLWPDSYKAIHDTDQGI